MARKYIPVAHSDAFYERRLQELYPDWTEHLRDPELVIAVVNNIMKQRSDSFRALKVLRELREEKEK